MIGPAIGHPPQPTNQEPPLLRWAAAGSIPEALSLGQTVLNQSHPAKQQLVDRANRGHPRQSNHCDYRGGEELSFSLIDHCSLFYQMCVDMKSLV